MKIEGLLPIGTVVMLKEGKHRVMITGYCQRLVTAPEKVYDYVGCLFPEGFLGADKNLLFDRGQVDRIYHVGYCTDGQMAYTDKIEEALAGLRDKPND